MDLNKHNKKEYSKHHKDMLGMNIPESYFAKSKSEILNAVSEIEKKEPKVIKLRSFTKYAIAASIVVLISIGILLKYDFNTNIESPVNSIENFDFANMQDDDVLINSLLTKDENMDTFLDGYIMNEIVVKAEESEMEFDNIFINSIFIKDSLLDNYIDENFIDNFIL